jgi:hypothetical protein
MLARQHPEKPPVHPLVERAQRRPSFQIPARLGIIEVIDQMLQNLGLDTSELAASCDEPSIEGGTAVQFETVEKLAREAVSRSA